MSALLRDTRAILARTPAVLRAMLNGLDPNWTDAPYGPATWSAREVVAHLVFNERTDWIPRLRLIMAAPPGAAPTFEPFDRAGHAPLLRDHSLTELLDLFERDRAASLRTFDEMNLASADLDRRALHPALGPVTLGNLLATWAVHDLNHIAQISKAMAYQHKPQVGPWEQYLSILAPPNPR